MEQNTKNVEWGKYTDDDDDDYGSLVCPSPEGIPIYHHHHHRSHHHGLFSNATHKKVIILFKKN